MPPRFSPDIDPTAIGTISAPPFARLPDPELVFADRAERFRFLARGSALESYLAFLARLSDVQAAIVPGLPEPAPIPDTDLAQAREHAMPPLRRVGFAGDAALDATFDALLTSAAAVPMPDAAKAAVERLRAATAEERSARVADVLADAVPFEAVAEHVLTAAVLQVHFARLAARLDPASLQPIGDALCPSCGSPPVGSMVVGWPGAESTRFCACPLCATLWHFVRVRCTACGETKGIGYQSVDGGPDIIKAETCDSCGSYSKLMQQLRDPAIDPLADDVASLAIDLLMRDTTYRRSAVNPFLSGY